MKLFLSKTLCSIILLSACTIPAYSQNAEELYQYGEKAYQEEDYDAAVDYFKKSASLGSLNACGTLSFMYYYGAIDGKRNIDLALLWAKRVGENKLLDVDCVLALIAYYNGNFEETKRILKPWPKETLYSEVKIALAVSYMLDGENQQAEPLVKAAYNQLDKENEYLYYAACAILAKIELENRGIENDSLYKYLDEFGVLGNDDFIYCPLSEYIAGLIFCSVADDAKYRDMGIQRIGLAAQYNYEQGFKILYPFATEIKKYYYSHR